ncbi:hypothetical protein YC2023_115322 [Brassica napus]
MAEGCLLDPQRLVLFSLLVTAIRILTRWMTFTTMHKFVSTFRLILADLLSCNVANNLLYLWSHTVVDPVPFSKTHVAWSQIDLGTNHIGASGIIFPIIRAEGVRQMFFPVTVPAYYRAPPVKGETKCS